MTFRQRMVLAVSAVTTLTLGGALLVIYLAVDASQERQLDQALIAEAVEEAGEIAALGGARLAISDRPGPAADDVGPLTKYGALYRLPGELVAATPTFLGLAPQLADVQQAASDDVLPASFNLRFRGEHLRAVLHPVPDHADLVLLLAAPRLDLDGDASFLSRAIAIVLLLAVLWSALVATWVVQRLTRDHEAIAAVAQQVTAGDLTARVGRRQGDPELDSLARNIDEMIERLGLLVSSQQRFIAHAAHELRSPLTTLYGELSHALRRPRSTDEYRRAIEESLDAARRLKLMAEDLLTLARLGSAPEDPTEPVDVLTALHEAIGVTAWEAEQGGVNVQVAGRGAVVRGHGRDLVRMFRNLVENAVRHSPAGGRVQIESHVAGDMVELVVADAGPGVPELDRARLFEPFFRGSHDRASVSQGAGLGLSIAREIARLHGGDIELVCPLPPATGARFLVRLPVAPARAA